MTLADLVSAALHNAVFTGIMGGSLVAGLLYSLKSIPGALWEFFLWRFTSELLVFNEDPAFEVVSDWLASLRYAQQARQLRLTTQNENELRFSPGIGKHLIWHRGRPVVVSRYVPDKSGAGGNSWKRREDIRIQTIGSTPTLMHDLIQQIMQARSGARQRQIEVHMFSSYWRHACRRDKRSLESVVMRSEQRDRIVRDIQTFLGSREWYRTRGVPYRRGLLFYGPPGCGKTSLVIALASHFCRPVYALNLGSVTNDEALIEAITTVPESAILLIEDIDAALAQKRAPVQASTPDSKEEPAGVTLSALLNAIDGVFSRDGRILIMTTNHPEKLDPALRRPGRVDRAELIGEIEQQEVAAMCEQFGNASALSLVRTPIAPAEVQRILLEQRSEYVPEAAE
jgi:chaperone BCS1